MPHQLLAHFRAIEHTPQLCYFRHCCGMDAKTRFLMALAGAIRAVQAPPRPRQGAVQDPALLRPQMAAQPHVLILAESIESPGT